LNVSSKWIEPEYWREMIPVRTKARTLSTKKKNAMISELRVRRESLLIQLMIRRNHLCARQFIGKQMNLVDQRRQALRANIFCLILEGQVQQWNLLIRAVAVQTYFFGFFVHGFSCLYYVIASRSLAKQSSRDMRLLRRGKHPPRNDMILQRSFIHSAVHI
jgi:hypothetical protein